MAHRKLNEGEEYFLKEVYGPARIEQKSGNKHVREKTFHGLLRNKLWQQISRWHSNSGYRIRQRLGGMYCLAMSQWCLASSLHAITAGYGNSDNPHHSIMTTSITIFSAKPKHCTSGSKSTSRKKYPPRRAFHELPHYVTYAMNIQEGGKLITAQSVGFLNGACAI